MVVVGGQQLGKGIGVGVGEVKIADCDHISCILLFGNARCEKESVCFNFEIYCSCSRLPGEHSINNVQYFILF